MLWSVISLITLHRVSGNQFIEKITMTNQRLKLSLAVLAIVQLWATGAHATDLSIPDTYTNNNPYAEPVTITDSGITSTNSSNSAIENDGRTTTIENSGSITGIYSAIDNQVTITKLINNGSIASHNYGIYNVGTIKTLTNSGSIAGNYGIDNGSTITTLTNNGSIAGNLFGINNYFGRSTITTLTNNGSITGTNSTGINNAGTITSLTNNGSVTGYNGITNRGTITKMINDGSIASTNFYGINNSGAITTLTNNGIITGSDSGDSAIYNIGTIATLTNNGSIAPTNSTGIDNVGTINTLTNNGSITSTDSYGIANGLAITTLTNNGSITGVDSGAYNGGTIGTLTNDGSITGQYSGIFNISTINTLTNNGHIVGHDMGIGNVDTINTLTNNGSIAGVLIGILNDNNGNVIGTITSLTNNGSITGGIEGIYTDNGSPITTLTNNGSITGGTVGIYNNSTITTLNNAQGGDGLMPATTALTYSGNLPTNYNITINSPTHYGQVDLTNVGGTTNFGIYAGSNVTNRFYGDVLSNAIGYVDNTQINGHLTGAYDNMTWTLVLDVNNYDLTFSGVSLAQTQSSLAQSALALRGVYDLQNVLMNNNLNNDCTLFDEHGICTSVTGTQHYLSGGVNSDTTSGTLIVAYRANDNVRVGAYIDQNLNTSNATGVQLNNGAPAFGAFAVWNANADGLGTQVKVAAGYADKDLTVTRQAVQTSEAGTGTTSLNSYGASAIVSYAMAMPGDILFSPYAGLRYTKVSADGYTEATSVNVTAPLNYGALTQNATTAIVGTKWTRHIADNAVAYASIGLEQDLNNNGGTYTATSASIVGLAPIVFNPNINRTRPTASIGSYLNLCDRQRIAANLVWSEQAFTANNATSLMVAYMAGF